MSIISFPFLLLLSFSTSVLSDDGLVLLKIKKQLYSPISLRSWVAGTDFCRWPYVYCRLNSRRVSGLSFSILYNDDISALFPRAICNLTELEELSIFAVKLYGRIPSCINKLSKLRNLEISPTALSGPVPGFPDHANLVHINLAHNQLSCSIPRSLSTLPKLKALDLSWNHLTGTIPPDLLNGSSSGYLYLNNNNLTGKLPNSYGSANFVAFDVARNRLSGDASFLFGKKKTVRYIYLNQNNFEFDLSCVEFPEKLIELDLSFNKIYGRIPNSLGSIVSINSINLSHNKLCGEVPQLPPFDPEGGEIDYGDPLPPCLN